MAMQTKFSLSDLNPFEWNSDDWLGAATLGVGTSATLGGLDGIENTIGDITGANAAEAAARAGDIQAQAALAGIDEQQRQFDLFREGLQPFVDQGLMGLQQYGDIPGRMGALTQQAGTPGGLDQRLSEIMGTGAFQGLVDQRMQAANNQLSQAGLTRSGAAARAAAQIPTDVALGIENMLYGRQAGGLGMEADVFGNIANLGQASAAGTGAAGLQTGANIANLLGQQGQAQANATLGGAQAGMQGTQNLLNFGATLAAMFSDPRLKDDMQPVGKVADLTLYKWKWKPELETFAGEQTIGYNADEVAEKYPQHVREVNGFKAIDYDSLNAELEAKIKEAA